MSKHQIILFIAFSFVSTVGFGQAYMDKIVDNACECVSQIPDTLDQPTYTMQLGICIMNAAAPYSRKLEKDYDIDFNRIEEHGEQLGKIIGLKMAGKCPELLVGASERVNMEDEVTILEDHIEGEITRVEEDMFIVFYLKDNEGKTQRFYWFTFIDSDFDLAYDYKNLSGKKADIYFTQNEYFDPKIKEYRVFNVITRVEVL